MKNVSGWRQNAVLTAKDYRIETKDGKYYGIIADMERRGIRSGGG